MAIASFSSGQLLAQFGWSAINTVIFPTIALAGVLLGWLVWQKRSAAAAV
jgi:hypothetical protein